MSPAPSGPPDLAGLGGGIHEDFRSPELEQAIRRALSAGEPPGERLYDGRNSLHRVHVAGTTLAWKRFGSQSSLKHTIDQRRGRGTKARRSFETAVRLQEHGVGTPQPVAWVDEWEGKRLKRSHYLSVFAEEQTSFKDALLALLTSQPASCRRIIDLLECVAAGVRAMHDAGVLHLDLGNQNILLSGDPERGWHDPRFIDLNRARLRDRALTDRERARDLSRITLPSDLRRVFFEMVYAPATVPTAFTTAEGRFRSRFALHTRTRGWRHPIRTRRKPPEPNYPPEKDLFIWDERSLQAIPALRSRDRRKHLSFASHRQVLTSSLKTLPELMRRQRVILQQAFREPVSLTGRIGLADEAGRIPTELPADVPLLLRFYHHETKNDWTRGLEQSRALRAAGHPVAAALVQCRNSVLHPGSWQEFAARILGDFDYEFAEIGHAVNRSKWGLWEMAEYGELLQGIHTTTPLVGPAVIDWEPHYLAAALDQVPGHIHFAALSHHLYVDRRGAPENRQGRHNLVGKLAALRAASSLFERCDERVFLTEVNWPLAGTGAWSPVTSPYDSPGPRGNDPSVDETTYANYMLRYLLLALCSGFAERVYWWKLEAEGFGLRDGTGRPRPAWFAFDHLLRTLGDATFLGRVPGPADRYLLRFDNGHIVGWSTGEAIPIPIPYTSATDSQGRPLTDPMLIGEPVFLCV